MLKKSLKIVSFVLLGLAGFIVLSILFLWLGITPSLPSPPPHTENLYENLEPVEVDSGLWVLEKNWYRQNRYGIWELYVEGDAFNRGVAIGKLSSNLVRYQEEVFVAQIDKVLPSKHYQRILLSLIAWVNKNLSEHILPEFLKEIYGISLSASDEFEALGPAYVRMMNYHAAHDIGHAMQSYYLVGCSSFASWDEKSSDSSLIIGRNFDFYFGDDFSRNKIIEFVKPDTGYSFAFVTWGGMTGVVSGMNMEGITVTINAGTLQIGKKSATPVTLLAREILQFASNTEEAISIAASRNIAVSETFLIGSAAERTAILIEKKPDSQAILQADSSALLCTNHFQSTEYYPEEPNQLNTQNNATGYRFERMQQLINSEAELSPEGVAGILRDKSGLENSSIGFGNEKAMNQFLAHHAIIFKPEERIMWISSAPNVMGAFTAYDLNEIFSGEAKNTNTAVDNSKLEISPDPFLQTSSYSNFLKYKSLSETIQQKIKSKQSIPDSIILCLVKSNPDYFAAYELAGDYYFSIGNMPEAKHYYKKALLREVNNESTRESILEKLTQCN